MNKLLQKNAELIKTKINSFPGYKPTKREQQILNKYNKNNSLKINK